eukprot:scaffold18007_cov65-Phaeocystis_antarctica.AAC.3
MRIVPSGAGVLAKDADGATRAAIRRRCMFSSGRVGAGMVVGQLSRAGKPRSWLGRSRGVATHRAGWEVTAQGGGARVCRQREA